MRQSIKIAWKKAPPRSWGPRKEFPVSIFSSIVSKIFPKHEQASADTSAASAATAPAPAAPQKVDIDAVLSSMALKRHEKLNWRSSIVDLLKVLDLDSSLGARQELARELHYTGDTKDTAAMNIWLQQQVLRKLEENGGVIPADLKDNKAA